jgi:hypothetical protein
MSIRTGRVTTIMLLLSGMACSADKAGGQSAGNSSQSTGSAALGSTWADAAKMPDLFSGMWMTFSGFVEGDAKLNVPYTAKAQKYVGAYKPKRDIPYAQEGCQSPGLPIAMRLGGGIKFTYAPGLISIYMQSVGHTRFIKFGLGFLSVTIPDAAGTRLPVGSFGWDGGGTRRFWAVPDERFAIVSMVPLIGPQAAPLQRTIEAIVMSSIMGRTK